MYIELHEELFGYISWIEDKSDFPSFMNLFNVHH